LRKERRLRVFENIVLMRIFGPEREREKAKGKNYLISSLMISTLHPVLFGVNKSRRMMWAGFVACMWERRSATGFCWENREK
jgi:hypothetical protein